MAIAIVSKDGFYCIRKNLVQPMQKEHTAKATQHVTRKRADEKTDKCMER